MIPGDAVLAPRLCAAGAVLSGAGSGLVLSGALYGLVREQLHISCGTYPLRSEGAGEWACADGIGYLWWAVVVGGLAVIVVLLGIAAALIPRSRTARTVLASIAMTSEGAALSITWYASSELVGMTPPGVESTEYWFAAVGPAALACCTGLILSIAGTMARGVAGVVLSALAALSVLAATGLQPGLAILFAPAAGMLAAGAVRAVRTPRPTRSAAGRWPLAERSDRAR